MSNSFSAENSSSVENHLRSGEANAAFVLLSPETQDKLVARVANSDRAMQTEQLAKVSQLDLVGLTDFAEGLTDGEDGEDGEQQAQANDTYTVKRGDSLSKIAQQKQIELKALIAANPQIKDPDLIYPDQILHLPN